MVQIAEKIELSFDFELHLFAPKMNIVRGQKKIFSTLKGSHQKAPTSSKVHCPIKGEARRLLQDL